MLCQGQCDIGHIRRGRSKVTTDNRTTLRNFIGGSYVDAKDGRTSEVIDPSSGDAYASAPLSGAGDVDAAFRAAEEAFPGWRDATPKDRSLALLKIADAIEARGREIVEAECRNT